MKLEWMVMIQMIKSLNHYKSNKTALKVRLECHRLF